MKRPKLSAMMFFFLWFVEQQGVMYAQQFPTPTPPAIVQPPVVVVQTTSEKIAAIEAEVAGLQKQADMKKAEADGQAVLMKTLIDAKGVAVTAANDPKLTEAVVAAKTAENAAFAEMPVDQKKCTDAFKATCLAEAALKATQEKQVAAEKAVTEAEALLTKLNNEAVELQKQIDEKKRELPDLRSMLERETNHREVVNAIAELKSGIKTELMTELASVKTAVEDGATKITNRIEVAEKRTETGLATLTTAVDTSTTKVTEKIDSGNSTLTAAVASATSTIQADITAVNTNVMAADAKIVGVQKQLVTIAEEVADTKEIANAFTPELQAAINGLKSEKFSDAQDPEPSDDLTAKVKELEDKLAPPAGLASVPAPPVEPVVTTPKAVVQQNVVYGNQRPVVQPQCQTYWNGYQYVQQCPRQAQQMMYSNNVVRTAPVQGWTYRQ